MTSELSRAELCSLVKKADLKPRLVVTDRHDSAAHLIEVGGFVQERDAPVWKLTELDEVRSVRVIGAYGVPVQANEVEA
jgi:hypothetical protein